MPASELAAVEQRLGTTQATQPSNGCRPMAWPISTTARAASLANWVLSRRPPLCGRRRANGMTESFVKVVKHDYVASLDKPDAQPALSRLAIAFERYKEAPHKALKERSRREFRHAAASST